MMYICSDTNVWIDFSEIKRVDLPFQLPYKYFISEFTLEEEVLRPATLKKTLLALGLKVTTLTIEEFIGVEQFMLRFKKLSLHDAMALSIAKERNWVLLTGDKNLFKAADVVGAEWHGTLWVLDELLAHQKINPQVYHSAMKDLLKAVKDKKCRLPKDEIEKRLISTSLYCG